jgi:hypothetical protein
MEAGAARSPVAERCQFRSLPKREIRAAFAPKRARPRESLSLRGTVPSIFVLNFPFKHRELTNLLARCRDSLFRLR